MSSRSLYLAVFVLSLALVGTYIEREFSVVELISKKLYGFQVEPVLVDCFNLDNKLPHELQKDILVAFTGDQSISEASAEVLRLIKRENAEVVILLGDLAYYPTPSAWDGMIESELGRPEDPDTPLVLSVLGNHDRDHALAYIRMINARLQRWSESHVYEGEDMNPIPLVECNGVGGLEMTCLYKESLHIITAGVGVYNRTKENKKVRQAENFDSPLLQFVRSQLSCSEHYRNRSSESENLSPIWSICAWHAHAPDAYILGGAESFRVFEACSEAGSIIATAHNHVYQRTFPFRYKDQKSPAARIGRRKNQSNTEEGKNEESEIDHLNSIMSYVSQQEGDPLFQLSPGNSLHFISGVGGHSVRVNEASLSPPISPMSKLTEALDNRLFYGAFFCRMNPSYWSPIVRENYRFLSRLSEKENKLLMEKSAECYFKTIDGRILDSFILYT